MSIKKLLLALLICLANSLFAQQQITQFSETPEEFFKQLETLMTTGKREAMVKVFDDFEDKYKSGAYTADEFKTIVKTCNTMLSLKLPPSPFFSDYLRGLTSINKYEQGQSLFDAWHKVLEPMLASNIETRKLEPLKVYFAFSCNFFEKNAIHYSDIGISWYASGKEFSMKYENGEPSVEWSQADLTCKRKQDSIVISSTSGVYYPITEKWIGKGGKVSWDRFEKLKDAYCLLSNYEIETIKGIYQADSVTMHYPLMFPDNDIMGSFEDKLVFGNEATEGSYPRFVSHNQELSLKNIGDGIECIGGFKLQGTTVYATGTKENKARIAINNKNNQLQFRSSAEIFSIKRQEKILAERVEIVLYFGADSIYHPSVNFKFDIPTRELNLNRGQRGSDRNPFFDSFHQVNISSDKIDWYLDKDTIIIGEKKLSLGNAGDNAIFESFKFFDESDYRKIQNISTMNPIAVMKKYADEVGGTTFSANDLAKRIDPKMDATSLQSLLYDLVAKGFVKYDADKQQVEFKDKIFHYANASQKKVDFDYLKIFSETTKSNASLALQDTIITINGVKNIEFSEKQQVALKPADEVVRLGKNRNLDFDGKLFAGFSTFIGKNFHFKYDQFQVDMDSARFFDLYVPTGEVDKKNNPVALAISSRIEKLNGVLLIDAPANKSGKENIPMFPSFSSKGPSYVYYDKKTTQEGCYVRDSFFFQLDKFSFNSLDKYTKEDIHFKGTMISANIFPDFKETLTLQQDTSLGFITQTPVTGYPTYSAKGNYTGEIDLNNIGFLGKGTLKYLGSTVNSEDIIFKPKQLLASAKRFDVKEDKTGPVPMPQAVGYDVKVDWKPYQDSMYITSKEKPFELFKEGNYTLSGTLILTPSGLKGRGLFDWDKASMTSPLFSFGVFSVSADTMNLQIKAIGAEKIALDTRNVNGKVDFNEQLGRFKANAENVITTLPYNQYQTTMNEFIWDMKNETINFKADSNKLASFLSIHPDQDSLTFGGKTAFYNLKNNELKIGGVPYIQAADAYVYTETGDIEVKENAVMSTLHNAKIICDTVNQYHVINRATVDIKGKKLYTATGYYEYNIGDRKQEILFDNIIGQRVGKGQMSEKKVVTRATGEVKETENFYIDLKTGYKGTISLNAESKNLQFDGFAKLDASNLPDPQWFSIHSYADKNDLAIAYDVPKNENGDPIQTGFFLSKETSVIYPRIMMPLYFRKDRPILDAKGVFKYNKNNDEFIFGDSAKILTGAKAGNKITYQNKFSTVSGEGKLNIGSGLKYLSVTSAGRAKTQFMPLEEYRKPVDTTTYIPNIPASKTTIDIMAGVEMTAPDKLLKMIVADIQASGFDLPDVDYTKDELYEKALAEFIPDTKEWTKTVTDMKNRTLDMPSKYNKFTFFFSKLAMKWDEEYQSFVSTDPKIGVNSIAGINVNKMLSGYVEFRMPSNEDDRLYIYLKSNSDVFYFIGYQQGVLSITSNNVKFNDEVINMKPKERVLKMPDGETYEIQFVEPTTAESFVRRVQQSQSKK